MTVKVDGFGVEHREHCEMPRWRTAEVMRRGVGSLRVQQCVSCGVVWRAGDAAGTVRHRAGYAGVVR